MVRTPAPQQDTVQDARQDARSGRRGQDQSRNINVSKVIYKARGSSLDIKLQKKCKYDDKFCTGCNLMKKF